MSLQELVLAGRAAALEIMVDACVIDRPTGQPTDPTTGVVTTTYSAPLYTGPCRIQQGGTQAGNPQAGERQATILGIVVQLPVDAVAYRVGDRVTLTLSVLDPALSGTVARVTSLIHKTHATSRRLVCDEVLA